MLIYVLIATFIYMGCYIQGKYNTIHYNYSLIVLFLFTAFRNVNLGGWDAQNYQKFFYFEVPQLPNFINYKPVYAYGYAFFNSIIKTISNDYRVYQVVYSALAIILLSIVIKKLQLYGFERSLFLFIYFCYGFLWNNFVLLRQNIAILLFWIILLTVFKKTVKYNIGILISSLWHKSSLVNILIYPILKLTMLVKKRNMLIVSLVLSGLFYLFSKTVFNLLANVFVLFAGAKYDLYINLASGAQGFNIINYIMMWIFLLIYYFRYHIIKNPHKNILLYSGFIVVILSSINIYFVERFVEYYMISIYSLITINNQIFLGKNKYVYSVAIYFTFMIILVRFLYTFSNGELLNYSTFFLGRN